MTAIYNTLFLLDREQGNGDAVPSSLAPFLAGPSATEPLSH